MVIPQFGEYEVRLQCDAHRPGDFSEEVVLYTDCPGKSIVTLKVEGKVVQAAGKDMGARP